jgi:Holliday junction DNA helicase RuvA
MIASLRGVLQAVGPDHLVVETGGVGWLVYVPRRVVNQAGTIGEEVFLHTRLVVREDALTLYGFATAQQRDFFDTLRSVSGVGPRVALNLLSFSTPDDIRMAVAQKDHAHFSRVPGIGKKGAERLVLELKSRLDLKGLPVPATPAGTDAQPGSPVVGGSDDLIEVLVSLGYSPPEARAAASSLPPDAPSDLEERLRLALRYFGGV